jgi:hypothetical protein
MTTTDKANARALLLKLPEEQLRIIARGGATGVCLDGRWIYYYCGQTITRHVNMLVKRRVLDITYFVGGKSGANLTDFGRVVQEQIPHL